MKKLFIAALLFFSLTFLRKMVSFFKREIRQPECPAKIFISYRTTEGVVLKTPLFKRIKCGFLQCHYNKNKKIALNYETGIRTITQ